MTDNEDKSFNISGIKDIIANKINNPDGYVIPEEIQVPPKLDSKSTDEVEEYEAEEMINYPTYKVSEHIPKDVSHVIHEAANYKRDAAAEESIKVFEELFTDLNAKYSLDVKINFKNFSETLRTMIDPRNKKIMELYLSESMGRFRSAIYFKLMHSIQILSNKILDPAELLSDETSYTDKFIIFEKLIQYMKMIEEVFATVKIESSDLQLENISTDTLGKVDSADEQVIQFLEALKKNVNSGTE